VKSERAAAPKTVDEYMASVPPKFRTALQRLRKTIKATAPEAEEVISYGMPAFRKDGTLVYYAAFTDHCSFFVGSPKVRRQFAAQLKPFAGGKGTFRFTPEHPLPAALVARIVKARLAENAARRAKRAGRARSA
jgi:uncharacterized protein YdhG (YjbR/CyaY superfamily)